MARYDLHSHSTCSDGALAPAQLVSRASGQGVDILALTDHDTTAGLGEALAAADGAGIILVPGVEVSVSWAGRVVHILGLGIDAESAPLRRGLEKLRRTRVERADKISKKLANAGISGSLEGAGQFAVDGALGRNHFARFLVEQGHARDLQHAFKRYLGRGGRCYVPCMWAALEEAVSWITVAGGDAVVAHPARYRMSATVMRRFLRQFRSAGGAGMEVVSSSHNPSQVRAMAAYAREFGLCGSAGSDFHAPGGWAELGTLAPLPGECVPIWAHWKDRGAGRAGRGREAGEAGRAKKSACSF